MLRGEGPQEGAGRRCGGGQSIICCLPTWRSSKAGLVKWLPGADVFVVDEAHQSPEIASQFFSATVTARQVNDLCRDALAEAGKVSGGLAIVQAPVQQCQQALKQLQAAIAEHFARARLLATDAGALRNPNRNAGA